MRKPQLNVSALGMLGVVVFLIVGGVYLVLSRDTAAVGIISILFGMALFAGAFGGKPCM